MDIEEVAQNVADKLLTGVDERIDTRMDGLSDQVRQQIEETLSKLDSGTAAGVSKPPADPTKHSPEAAGAELDGKFESFAEFLKAVNKLRSGQRDPRLKALGESDGAGGGALVPEEFRAQLLSIALQDAVIRPRAFQIPMESLVVALPAVRDTDHSSNVFGGVQAFWTEEGGSITESQPTFARVRLEAKKLAFFTSVPNELVSDSAITLESVLLQLFGAGITFFEEEAYIRGSGAGQPLGFLNGGAVVEVAKESGQPADTIVVENLVNMYSRMLPVSQARGIWLAHPNTFPELATMALSVGTGGSAVFISNIADAPPMSIFGRPLFFNEHMSTLGDAGDIAFIDPSFYLIGDRQTLTIESSAHVKFQNDDTVWRGIERLDGRPWVDSAITPAQGSTTLSPFVTLAARA